MQYAGQSCCVIDAAGNPVCDGCAADDIPEPGNNIMQPETGMRVVEALSTI